MDTANKQNTLNKVLIACALVLVGCTLLGLGIGIILSQVWASTIIGLGTGFLICAGQAFNKLKEIRPGSQE